MDALSGVVAPIAAYKINVKVDWSSLHFLQNFYIRIKHEVSCTNVCQVPQEMLNTEGDRSDDYEGNRGQPWMSC